MALVIIWLRVKQPYMGVADNKEKKGLLFSAWSDYHWVAQGLLMEGHPECSFQGHPYGYHVIWLYWCVVLNDNVAEEPNEASMGPFNICWYMVIVPWMKLLTWDLDIRLLILRSG